MSKDYCYFFETSRLRKEIPDKNTRLCHLLNKKISENVEVKAFPEILFNNCVCFCRYLTLCSSVNINLFLHPDHLPIDVLLLENRQIICLQNR